MSGSNVSWYRWDERLAENYIAPWLKQENLCTANQLSVFTGICAVLMVLMPEVWFFWFALSRWLDHADGRLARITTGKTMLGKCLDNGAGFLTWSAICYLFGIMWLIPFILIAQIIDTYVQGVLKVDMEAVEGKGLLGWLTYCEAGRPLWWLWPLGFIHPVIMAGLVVWTVIGTFAYGTFVVLAGWRTNGFR